MEFGQLTNAVFQHTPLRDYWESKQELSTQLLLGMVYQVTQTQPCAGNGRDATHTYTHTQVHIRADTGMHTPSHTHMRRDAHLEAPGELTSGDSVLDQGLGTSELRGRLRALGCWAPWGSVLILGEQRGGWCVHTCVKS